MAQPFYARKLVLNVGPRKGETVYFAQAHYYGVISTKDMAEQIAEESALTAADVKAVIDRLVYFCKRNMTLGYKISIDGLGTFYNELLTGGSVASPEEVDVKLVRKIRPAFKPEYTIVNGNFRYALLPEKTELVKIDFRDVASSGTESPSGGSGENPEDGKEDSDDGDSTGGTPVSPGAGGSDVSGEE